LLHGSGYDGRQPIGSDTAIKAMTPDLLRRFYDTWYRPDNAAIMIVGDIDVDKVETKIRDQFEGLSDRGGSGTQTGPALASFGEAAVKVLADPDATTGDAEFMLPAPAVADPLPREVPLNDLPAGVTRDVPLVEGHQFAKFEDRILVVNTESRVVVAMIPRYKLLP
jgi:predicted Zn-dependent peptidase